MPKHDSTSEFPLTAAHWGVYRAEVCGGKLHAIHPFEQDADPSEIAQGYLDTIDSPLRIKTPMVRKGWLENGPTAHTDRRGKEPFVQVSWQEAEQLVATELERVRSCYGNQAIYGGSYGWSGAGRFHHAQSQLHRFLNCIGGYTSSVNTYSLAAGEVILRHTVGKPMDFILNPPTWQSMIDHTDLVVAFGGMPLRNAQISSGGTGQHRARAALAQAKQAGVSFVNISPIRSDMADELDAQWIPAIPNSDVAIMLAIAHEILRHDWQDTDFLNRYTVGFEEFARYLLGETDGVVKTIEWAAEIARIPAEDIAQLAKRMVQGRTIISVSWSLTRQEHGEQPFWMATTLAAMLGQIGLAGGGVAYGYCASNAIGLERQKLNYASLPQLKNSVIDFIPVARISDMLLNPKKTVQFSGQSLTYPDIQLIYWAGGNPFHHHQDLTKLCTAWQKPETIIVHEWCWNALAKRADIVLPCTTQLERNDLMLTPRDPHIIAMRQAIPPVGEARNDYDILAGVARHMDCAEEFTEGRDAAEWLEWLYQESQKSARESDVELPSYTKLCTKGWHKVALPEQYTDIFTAFRADPENAPLDTPSGKIEITCSAIGEYGDSSLSPYPCWRTPNEWLGNTDSSYRFHLISSQPPDKLHSQMDHGMISRKYKRSGRAPLGIHPQDAKALNITDGDLVRVYNDRGACLAVASLNEDLLQGVLQLSTGAWLDAVEQENGTLLCRHGNPNVLTQDVGTSNLAQGPSAHSCLVSVEKYHDTPQSVEAFSLPLIE